MAVNNDRGLVIVYTGDGKGKTTAALGLALRAAGHGNKTLIIQFLKSDWEYGERKAIERLAPEVSITPMGIGCIGILGDDRPIEEHRQAAQEAFAAARAAVLAGKHEIVILDEINIAIHYHLIAVDEVLALIAARPKPVTLVFTGRWAEDRIIEAADLVTEMKEIKHPYRKGMISRKGIDY